MPVGYDLSLLQGIACNAIAINAAAGGATAFNRTDDYFDTIQTIACQLRAANVALGTDVGGGGFDSIGNMFVAIACQAQAMAAVTGAPNAMPFDPYSALSVWNAIDCALGQVATNTGTGYDGWSNDSVLNEMKGALCLTAQIVENGFTPVDPVQAFIDAINAFHPDRFFLYGRGMFSNSGGTTPAAPGDNLLFFADESGNVDHLVPNAVPAGTPSIDASSVLLDGGTARGMTQAYTNSGDQIFVIAVVQQSASAPNAFDRIASFSNGGDDYNSSSYFLFFANPTTGDLGLFWNGGQRTTMNPADITDQFHTVGAMINAGTNVSKVFKDAAVQVGTASSIGPLGITHFGIGFQATSGDGYFRGQYKAAAVWNTVPSDADITTIIGLFRTFYGTP